MDHPMTVQLDRIDCERLLFETTRAAREQEARLVCLCGATADTRQEPHSADGWQVAPTVKCDRCIAREMRRGASC